MLANLSVHEILEKTASKDPVPGGGSMSALNGAICAGLVEMVANLTVGRKGFEAVAGRMTEIAETARECRRHMIENVDRDSEAFDRVMQAFRMPKETDEQKNARTAAIQESFKQAARIPLQVAQEALELLDLAAEVAEKGNRNALTDGAVGVLTARTAVLGALFNVRINLQSINDPDFAADMGARADALAAAAIRKERAFLSCLAL